jgi:uncharacterized protein YyaL (SSP411 family)
MSADHKHTNQLAREKSPYLLQHAHNPVDWFAWGDEAFAKARAEDKPVLLSIGYSTCHWCHVMERESFEDEKLGAFLREHFVSIKVDREERPDVDKIYMTFVQSTTGSGGWPLNVFLTPDLKPFFGGTYFPPDQRHGRPSFRQLLQQIAGLWRERRLEIGASADELHARLELITAREGREDSPLTPETLRHAAAQFKEAYDPANGGFGGAPKFPQPSIPLMMLRVAKRFGDEAARNMVLHTCERMAAGGIHDQLGGGFARYAVDAEWLVPHFEKMLYDNAQLVQLYLDAYLISGEAAHAATARDILDYVRRDMTHPAGGFYSAEDADSEGQEGKFYCWTHDELSKLLSPEEFIVTAEYFGITKAGNFVDHSHPNPLPGLNVLSIVKPIAQSGTTAHERSERAQPPASNVAQASRLPAEQNADINRRRDACATLGVQGEAEASNDQKLLDSAKQKMLAVRARRIRPHLDDKILASWNGLMLGAFARASVVLGEKKYRAAAEKNLQFIRENLWESPSRPAASVAQASRLPAEQNADTTRRRDACATFHGEEALGKPNGTLFHRWRDGERDQVQLLEAYAFLLDGVIQLYEATLHAPHLDFAGELAAAMIAKFYDPANGGFWQSPAGTNDLILRVKDDYDGAEPSGNSVATLALLKLAAITGRADFRTPAEATLQLAAGRLQKQPAALACMLSALDFWLDEPRRVVIAGNANSTKFQELLRAAHAVYQPNKIVLGTTGGVEPFAKTLTAKSEAEVFVCLGSACQLPTGEAGRVRELISSS